MTSSGKEICSGNEYQEAADAIDEGIFCGRFAVKRMGIIGVNIESDRRAQSGHTYVGVAAIADEILFALIAEGIGAAMDNCPVSVFRVDMRAHRVNFFGASSSMTQRGSKPDEDHGCAHKQHNDHKKDGRRLCIKEDGSLTGCHKRFSLLCRVQLCFHGKFSDIL